jgi:hypothetical protein
MNSSTAPEANLPIVSEERVPTSILLERLIRDAPTDHVTLAWLLAQLRTRSFGIVLLLLGICGLLPVISPVAGLMLGVPAIQMIRAQPAPVFPRRLTEQRVATGQISTLIRRIIPPLRFLERFIRPRWPTPFQTTKRVIGGFVLLLGLCLLTPIPLSNVPVGLAIVLVAVAYLEEDGLLLTVSLVVALSLLAAAAATLWTTIATVLWVTGG